MTDTGFQPRDQDPQWNESSFITFRVPDRRLMGVLYHYFRPNQQTAMGGPVLFDHTGEELGTCLLNAFDWNMPMPADADMFDFSLANGYSSRTLEPEHRFELRYDGPDCRFELTYTADIPPHGLTPADQSLGAYFSASGHYDQYGTVDGHLDMHGDTIAITGAAALRDRSWGPRRMLSNTPKPRGSYLFARADPGSAFQATVLSDLPADRDPINGTVEHVRAGFYVRDGITAALVSGERRVTQRGRDGRPEQETLDAVDDHGRVLHATGTIGPILKWHGIYGDIIAFWCYERWTFDGHAQAPGENQEFFPARTFRRWAAGLSDSPPAGLD